MEMFPNSSRFILPKANSWYGYSLPTDTLNQGWDNILIFQYFSIYWSCWSWYRIQVFQNIDIDLDLEIFKSKILILILILKKKWNIDIDIDIDIAKKQQNYRKIGKDCPITIWTLILLSLFPVNFHAFNFEPGKVWGRFWIAHFQGYSKMPSNFL